MVTLNSEFAETVNTEADYKVFPVPNGDCKGLSVANKTATSFECEEDLAGGVILRADECELGAARLRLRSGRQSTHSQSLSSVETLSDSLSPSL